MAGEKPSVRPEDLIEQNTPNKGNIADIDLAQKGAYAEEDVWLKENKTRMHLNDTSGMYEITKVPQEMTQQKAFTAGQEGMGAEVAKRAKNIAADKAVSLAAKDRFVQESVDDFKTAQKELTDERVEEEVKKIKGWTP